MSKYDPLTSHLRVLRGDHWRARLSDVERIVGFRLPESARTYPAWWANDARQGRQCMAWMSAGWRTEDVDLGSEEVTFRRYEGASQSKPWSIRNPLLARPRPSPPSPGPAPVDMPSVGSVDLSIRLEWRPLGQLRLDPSGGLRFPAPTQTPGLYRFRLRDGDSERRYIGETDNLQRRFQHYRTPGPTQTTNVRLNQLFLAHLHDGGQIDTDVATDGVQITVGGASIEVNLAEKATRRLLEYGAIVAEAGVKADSLNL